MCAVLLEVGNEKFPITLRANGANTQNLKKIARGDMYNILSIYPFFLLWVYSRVFEGTHFSYMHRLQPWPVVLAYQPHHFI
jgi:hypothetical protein